ncbi:hypothetical protein AKJ16_DCAP18686 [Drosera capensis]
MVVSWDLSETLPARRARFAAGALSVGSLASPISNILASLTFRVLALQLMGGAVHDMLSFPVSNSFQFKWTVAVEVLWFDGRSDTRADEESS